MALLQQTNGFFQNAAAYAASEVAAKASRVVVVLAVARVMEPAAIGLAAAALAVSEIAKSMTENGVCLKIISVADNELEAACRAGHRLFWVWCSALCAIQILGAFGFFLAGGDILIAIMIGVLAVEYLFIPGGLVQCALAMRSGCLKDTALVGGTQVVGANLLTAVLVLAWPSPLALVLPKVISAPVWLLGMRRLNEWRPNKGPRLPACRFLRFGTSVLGIEVLRAVRLQADKLIIGGLLGAEALGAWFFAANAGLGLATSFASAFSTVLFPHLCAASDRDRTFVRSLGAGVAVLTPVVLLQALLAPIYVPLLFGERWEHLASVVSILCLAAVPALIWAATAQWLRSNDRAGIEFRLSAVFTVVSVFTLAVLAQQGLEATAWGVLVSATIFQCGACALLFRAHFRTHFRGIKEA